MNLRSRCTVWAWALTCEIWDGRRRGNCQNKGKGPASNPSVSRVSAETMKYPLILADHWYLDYTNLRSNLGVTRQ
jgi:hypothetical protein